jgi:predicted DCC family thiol-disulfide oxidoreductase YuxK
MSHGYGASYVDVPSNVFMSTLQNSDASQALLSSISGVEAKAKVEIKHHAVSKIIRLIGSSSRYVLHSFLIPPWWTTNCK